MNDDPIREALRAAAEAAFDPLREVWPGDVPPASMPIAAAAVAAFLRGLGPHYRSVPCGKWSTYAVHPDTWAALAVAAERAAGGGDE
jgi:hypothetical protein